MFFIYKKWDKFCKNFSDKDIHSITAKSLLNEQPKTPYLIYKHDVETKVKKALKIAEIENKYGHRGSYYVQAYLLENEKNVEILKKIQDMGHEVTYHHDVLDANRGDLEKALVDFENKCKLFEEKGFNVQTVCQHGNPMLERNGYTSNRDFFRSEIVQQRYPNLTDIMVDFKDKACGKTDYLYFSDAGRRFNLIFDPINNDYVDSDDKNVTIKSLDAIYDIVTEKNENAIISIHPHRWVRTRTRCFIGLVIFKTVRLTAKILRKIPFAKKLVNKYNYLAKKF